MDVKELDSPDEAVTYSDETFLYQGMPELKETDTPVSFFEFWPPWAIYTPVVIQWLYLSVKFRSFSLPLIANPAIPLSGMVGESKAGIFSQAKGEAKKRIAPWGLLSVHSNRGVTLCKARQLMRQQELEYPLVAKPDIGCRGAGVRVIKNSLELKKYVEYFPEDSGIILQQLITYQPEAGLFYIRIPGEKKGKIISITLKYPPYVVGNGISTLEQLIKADPRAGRLTHLYFPRYKKDLSKVVPEGKPFRLVFSGSHCRGSIFKDGRKYITPELTKAIDNVCDGLSEYFYGRIDIRFKDMVSLMNGQDFLIQEINGASSEAAHIWDSQSSLSELYRVLFYQYRMLFKLGRINRERGFKTPGLIQLFKAWRKEKQLASLYPETE